MRKLARNTRLATILDPIDRPLLVITSTGRVAHETPATTALLHAEIDATALLRRAALLCRAAATSTGAVEVAREWAESRRQFEICTSRARYSLFAIPAGRNTLLAEDSVIVDITKHPLPVSARIPAATAVALRDGAVAAEHALRRIVAIVREMLSGE